MHFYSVLFNELTEPVRVQVLVHVTATDVDDSDQHLPITYNLIAADGFAIDHNRSLASFITCYCI